MPYLSQCYYAQMRILSVLQQAYSVEDVGSCQQSTLQKNNVSLSSCQCRILHTNHKAMFFQVVGKYPVKLQIVPFYFKEKSIPIFPSTLLGFQCHALLSSNSLSPQSAKLNNRSHISHVLSCSTIDQLQLAMYI